MFNWFKKLRNTDNDPSLRGAEQLLRSANYPSAKPTPAFSSKLKEQLLAHRRANPSHMEKVKSLFRWKTWLPVTAGALAVLLLTPYLWPFGSNLEIPLIPQANAFAVEALDADVTGVEADTRFKVTAQNPIEKEAFKQALKLEPAGGRATVNTAADGEEDDVAAEDPQLDFSIRKLSDTEFEVRPDQPLESGTVYNVVIETATDENGVIVPDEQRFAFQVKDTFKVFKSTPGDKRDRVPLNTGIEVVFSHPTVAVADFQANFSISPAVKGRFDKFGRILAFIPEQPLAPETLYKVTVASELPLAKTEQTLGQAYSFEFFTNTVREQSAQDSSLYFRNADNNFPAVAPGKPLELPVNVRNLQSDAQLQVYKFESIQDFVEHNRKIQELPEWICYSCLGMVYNTDDKEPLLQMKLSDALVDDPAESFADNRLLRLPAFDQKGIYVIEIDAYKRQMPFQVTNLQGYSLTSAKKSLLWVHQNGSGEPIANADVRLLESEKRVDKTSTEGVVEYELAPCEKSQSERAETIHISNGEDDLIFLLNSGCAPDEVGGWWFTGSSKYWATLNFDRTMYRPTDTVQFWGLALERPAPPIGGGAGSGNAEQELTVRLLSGDYLGISEYSFGGGNDRAEDVVTVRTNDIGSYRGELKLDNVAPGSYTVEVTDADGHTISTKWITVETYFKPALQLHAEINKEKLRVGEDIVMDVAVTFFDGTPVGKIELNYRSNQGSRSVTTDENGKARIIEKTEYIEFEPQNSDSLDDLERGPRSIRYPHHSYFVFSVKNAELGQSVARLNSMEFYSDYYTDLHSFVSDKDEREVGGVVKKIDMEKEVGFLGEPVEGVTVTSSITIEHERKSQIGTDYDPISKTSTPRYYIDYVPEFLTNVTSITDAEGKFTVDFPFENKRYKVRSTVKDPQGRADFSERTYYFQNENNGSSYQYFYVRNTDSKRERHDDEVEIGYETVMAIYVDEEKVAGEGRALFFEAQAGIQDAQLISGAEYTTRFRAEDLPNKYIGAIWFDGDSYSYAHPAQLRVDVEERKLDVSITLDKEEYRPRGKVTATVEVKDKDGRPRAAEVHVKAIDEAIYALREEFSSPIVDIYAPLTDGILERQAAESQAVLDIGGKGGGGGDGGARSLFKDTALFDVVRTGSNGKGTVTFELPDDVTTFRLTGTALTNDLFVGEGKSPVVSTLPFFVDVTTNSIYTVKDKPAVRFRVAGPVLADAGIDTEQEVTYTVSIPSLGVQSEKVTRKAGERFWYTLPTLKTGTHTMTVRAQYGNLSDAVQKKIEVKEGLLTVPVTREYEVKAGGPLVNPGALSGTGRSKIIFSLEPYGTYYRELQELRSSYTNRLDAKLARHVAQQLLMKHYNEPPPFEAQDLEQMLNYQSKQDGGLQLFPYDSSDLELSFKAARFARDIVDVSRLDNFFISKLDKDQYESPRTRGVAPNVTEVIWALAGRANLGRPVLNDLNLFRESNTEPLSIEHKLTLAYAYAVLGDFGSANGLLDEVLVEKSKFAHEGVALVVRGSDDENTNRELTALAASSATLARHKDAAVLWEGARLYESTRTLNVLEHLAVLDAQLSRLPRGEKGSVRYIYDGREEIVALEKADTHSLTVPSGTDVGNVHIVSVSGPVEARVHNEAPPYSSQSITRSETLKLERHYEVNGKRTTTFKEGDLVTVVLTPTISREPYPLPSNEPIPLDLAPLSPDAEKELEKALLDAVEETKLIKGKADIARVSDADAEGSDALDAEELPRTSEVESFSEEPAIIPEPPRDILPSLIISPPLVAPLVAQNYEVIDLLPAGLLPVTTRSYFYSYRAQTIYPTSVEGQRVYFNIWQNREWPKQIRYLARVAAKGEFVAEPAIIQEVQNPARLNLSSELTITITQ